MNPNDNQPAQTSPVAPVNTTPKTSLWVKTIPKTNRVFFIIGVLLVFLLDLPIALEDSSMMGFWQMMIFVLGIFALFYFFENKVLKKKFEQSAIKTDSYIYNVIVLRNLIFLLNFIPLIQLLGLMALSTVGLVLMVAYISLLVHRQAKTPTLTQSVA